MLLKALYCILNSRDGERLLFDTGDSGGRQPEDAGVCAQAGSGRRRHSAIPGGTPGGAVQHRVRPPGEQDQGASARAQALYHAF